MLYSGPGVKMKILSGVLFFIFIYCGAFAFNVIFPEFYAYSEYNSSNSIVSSYLIDMVLDTGLKYGVKLGLGLKEYNISSIPTNNAGLDSIKVYLNPVDSLNIGYFIGKNVTLGIAEIGYQGFQFHQAPGLEYIGYKDINGTGIEAYMDFMDDLLQPHIYIYQPSDTNQVNIDTVWYLNLEHYIFQAYFGINNANILGIAQQYPRLQGRVFCEDGLRQDRLFDRSLRARYPFWGDTFGKRDIPECY